MSPKHRALLFVVGWICIACTGGTVYGWPSMRRMMKRNETLGRCTNGSRTNATLQCELEQEQTFSLIFSIGAWGNQGGRLPAGGIRETRPALADT